MVSIDGLEQQRPHSLLTDAPVILFGAKQAVHDDDWSMI